MAETKCVDIDKYLHKEIHYLEELIAKAGGPPLSEDEFDMEDASDDDDGYIGNYDDDDEPDGDEWAEDEWPRMSLVKLQL